MPQQALLLGMRCALRVHRIASFKYLWSTVLSRKSGVRVLVRLFLYSPSAGPILPLDNFRACDKVSTKVFSLGRYSAACRSSTPWRRSRGTVLPWGSATSTEGCLGAVGRRSRKGSFVSPSPHTHQALPRRAVRRVRTQAPHDRRGALPLCSQALV